MSTFLRCLAILAAVAILVLFLTPVLSAAASSPSAAAAAARPQVGSAEGLLLDAANRDRAAVGLPALQWDSALAASARQHAQRMAQRHTLSHQFPGEASLQERAAQNGARFSVIAENVAEGSSATGLHTQWMNSPPHRANLLDPDLNAVGIAVTQSGNMLFAAEDFSQAVPSVDLDGQEMQVARLLARRGLRVVNETPEARKTCDMDRGFAGPKPLSVLRYETTDLRQLPDDIDQKVQSGKYHSAAIGACNANNERGFSRFRIAILLFP